MKIPRKLKKKIKTTVRKRYGKVEYKITGLDKTGNGFFIESEELADRLFGGSSV